MALAFEMELLAYAIAFLFTCSTVTVIGNAVDMTHGIHCKVL